MGDYWDAEDARPIHIKEAYGLLNTLQAVSSKVANKRVDALVDRAYAFPPFSMTGHLLSFMVQEGFSATVVIQKSEPCPTWWPLALEKSRKMITLGRKGEKNIILLSSHKGFVPDKKGLRGDLVAILFHP